MGGGVRGGVVDDGLEKLLRGDLLRRDEAEEGIIILGSLLALLEFAKNGFENFRVIVVSIVMVEHGGWML